MDNAKLVEDTYNAVADKFDKEYCQTIYYQKELDEFLTFLPEGVSILDVGCGSGHVAEYLTDKGFDVFGIDSSEKMIELAEKKAPTSQFQEMDLREMDFDDESFHGIICTFTLCHVNEDEFQKTIAEFARIINSGGALFLGLIEGKGDEVIAEPLNDKYKIYFSYYSKEFVEAELKKNGFEVLKVIDHDFNEKNEKQKEFFVIAQKK